MNQISIIKNNSNWRSCYVDGDGDVMVMENQNKNKNKKDQKQMRLLSDYSLRCDFITSIRVLL